MLRPAPLLLIAAAASWPRPGLAAASAAEFDEDLVAWVGWVAQGDLTFIDPDWTAARFLFDGQLRWREDLAAHEMSLLRPALGYALNPRWTAHLGYAWIQTYPDSGVRLEHRPWEQLQWRDQIGEWTAISRSRLEQRFFEGEDDVGNRFRQMFRGSLPLYGPASPYLALSDELFFDLDDTSWGQRGGLRQNRVFAGLGFFLDEQRQVALEVGYLNQWLDRSSGDDRMNHVLSLTLFTNF
jgi:hypothetical protein